ncbi:MAG: hypothetical protein JW809_14810 [Pirellulales bacterium]|nr:hypothetical protein [Pirellulales bacterium]
MSQYLQIRLELSKWYISEGFKNSRLDNDTNQNRRSIQNVSAHNKPKGEMVLGGAYDTEEEAKRHLADFSDAPSPFVWQCSETDLRVTRN